jgi:hypothetical protein
VVHAVSARSAFTLPTRRLFELRLDRYSSPVGLRVVAEAGLSMTFLPTAVFPTFAAAEELAKGVLARRKHTAFRPSCDPRNSRVVGLQSQYEIRSGV